MIAITLFISGWGVWSVGAGVGIAFYNRSPFPIPHSLFPLIHQVFTLIARKASSSDSQTWRMARGV